MDKFPERTVDARSSTKRQRRVVDHIPLVLIFSSSYPIARCSSSKGQYLMECGQVVEGTDKLRPRILIKSICKALKGVAGSTVRTTTDKH